MRSNLSFSLKERRDKNKLDNRTGLVGWVRRSLLYGTLVAVLTCPAIALAQSPLQPAAVPDNPAVDVDIPEEILRTEIITEARSPITGEPMTAAEYAQLQAELSDPITDGVISDDLRYLIFLLQIRRSIRPIIPFL